MKNRNLITRNDMHILYRVMLKRIAKGYSSEELSFLIGAEPDYVAKVEMLELDVYNMEEIQRIGKALEESNLKNFYVSEHLEGKIYAEMTTFEQGNELHHYSKFLDEKDEIVPSFTLIEHIANHQKTSGMNDDDYKMAKDVLKLLKDSGYFFVARSHQQIFNRIKRFLPAGTLSPFYIKQALLELSTDYHTEELQAVNVPEVGPCYIEF